jgi:GR25 family glycosyltransferase involved in LPS biosynthesis
MNQSEHTKNVMSFVIHLNRAIERETQVEAICVVSPFPTVVISAIDARGSDGSSHEAWGRYQQDLLVPRYPNALRDAEVACFRSHRKCWAMIIEKGLDAALIVEDDVEIDPKVFADAVAVVMPALAPGDFVRFPYKRREVEGEVIAGKGEVVLRRPREVALGMQAQIVTRDAARKLLDATQSFDRPIDCLLQMPWEHGARVLSVWPSGVHEKSGDLGGSTIGHKTSGFAKIKREIQRPIYRHRLSRLARAHFDREVKNLQ